MAVKNIMIVGVGGQGTLLTSRILGGLTIAGGYDVKLSEVHGMAQRGGSVVTFVRYGEKVAEPIVEEGQADVIIAFVALTCGGITVDKAAHRVIIDGKDVDLSYKEFELLTYFMENKGIALSREKILNNVWNYDYFGDARTIDTHVKKLRSKLGEEGNLIKTIWGMGYKMDETAE